MAIVVISNCRGIGGACGAVGLVAGTAFKPLAFVLFVFTFCGIAVRRAGDAGMPGPVGLFIPFLIKSKYAFLIYAAAPWSVGFSAGVLLSDLSMGFRARAVLHCRAVHTAVAHHSGGGNPFGIAGWMRCVLGAVIAANVALQLAVSYPGIQLWLIQSGVKPGYLLRVRSCTRWRPSRWCSSGSPRNIAGRQRTPAPRRSRRARWFFSACCCASGRAACGPCADPDFDRLHGRSRQGSTPGSCH